MGRSLAADHLLCPEKMHRLPTATPVSRGNSILRREIPVTRKTRRIPCTRETRRIPVTRKTRRIPVTRERERGRIPIPRGDSVLASGPVIRRIPRPSKNPEDDLNGLKTVKTVNRIRMQLPSLQGGEVWVN